MSGVDRRTVYVGLVRGLWSVVVWAVQFVIIKEMYAHVGSIQINSIRYLFIALILVAQSCKFHAATTVRAGGA